MEKQMKNAEKVSVRAGEILYWLFFGSLLFAKGIGLYDGQAVFKLVLVFAAACLALKIVSEKYTAAELAWMFLIIALTFAAYLMSGEKGLLLYGMMMVGLKHVDIKKVFCLGGILWAAAFFGITLTSLFHMGDTVYKVHSKLGMGHIFRWSLGYPHPNVLQVSYFVLAVFIIYFLGDKFKLRHAFWLFAGNCLVFLYSVSYTGFIIFMCLLLGRLYLLFRKKFCFLEKLLLQMIFPACVLISLIVPVTIDVNGKQFKFLNKVFSQRLELGWLYLRAENISLWGRRLSEITSSSKTMDNAYLFAFITYGIIPFVFLCAATMYMLYRYLKEDKQLEALMIVSIIVGGITEPFLYNTSFKNLSFLFMGALLFSGKAGRKEWSLIPERIGLNKILGRQIEIKTHKIDVFLKKARAVFCADKRRIFAGILGALLLAFAVNRLISYPEGYVVYRADCSDISQEKQYYDENNPDYASYKKMHSFSQGEEIEYFGGNIVVMEKVRNNIMGLVMGCTAGYAAMGIWIMLRSGGGKTKEAANEK
ncbi:MAG: hypothetical protein NC400_00700 [Clostridium sp.]|nr:hypothetical protein [Clostridium sp.]